MLTPNTQRIFDTLMVEAGQVGKKAVLDACKMFIKAGGEEKREGERRPPMPKAWVKQALIRQGMRCNICRQPLALDEAAGDHVEPWSRHGPHKPNNVAAVHDVRFGGTCNQEKGAKGLYEESKRSGNLLSDMMPNLPEEG